MKHFINKAGELYAFEDDGSQDHLITEEMVLATDEQVKAIQRPSESEAQKKARINAVVREQLLVLDPSEIRANSDIQIAMLQGDAAAIETARARLLEVRAQKEALRKQMKQ